MVSIEQESVELSDAIESLRGLRAAQKKYFANPRPTLPERWDLYEKRLDRAVQTLNSPRVAGAVDSLISSAVQNGLTSTSMATSIMRSVEVEPRVSELERSQCRSLGYSDTDFNRFIKDAQSSLASAQSKHETLSVPLSSTDLIERLYNMHEQVKLVYQAPRDHWSRRERRQIRGQVRRNAEQELYAVGALVANAQFAGDFRYSLALSLGVTGAGTPGRRQLRRAVESLASAA